MVPAVLRLLERAAAALVAEGQTPILLLTVAQAARHATLQVAGREQLTEQPAQAAR